MGAEEKTPKTDIAKPTEATAADAAVAPPPPEEPPKLEEIVTDDVLKLIINGYNPDLSLVSFEARPGSKIGDNYMSIMYAVDLELKNSKTGATEKLEVMLKTIPRNVFRADMINEMKAFTKEATIYQKVLPIFIQLQEEKDVPKESVFRAWPTCYAAHLDGQTDFLAMENLKVLGYTMGSRVNGLDFNHCSSVLRNLAKYHAISYVKYGGCRNAILEDFPMLKDSMFDKTNKLAEMQQQFFSQSFLSQGDILKEMGEDLAASRMHKLAKADLCSILGDLIAKDIDCAIISHGDCWVNNMLFKYSESDTKATFPESIKFIDFQLSQATSRLVDIYYFLMTSSKINVLNEREQDLLMVYYTEFTSFAERLGVNTKEKGLTWENLMKEADRYRLYGVFMGLLLAPMLAADAADIPDMESFTAEDFENSDETVKKFYKDLTKGHAIQKAKNMVLNHLPKCFNGTEFL